MKMLARSWRTLRQLTPAERKQLATAVGADGAEDILGKLAAHKGRVGPAFLAPALEKLKEMDAEALTRLVEVVRDPDQRREAMRKGARAVGDVLIEEPVETAEEVSFVDDELEVAVDAEPVAEPEVVDVPTVEPQEELPIVLPRQKAVSPPPPPLPLGETVPRRSTPIATQEPEGVPGLDRVRGAPTLARRLTSAREALDGAEGWTVDQLRSLIEIFPQEWARRRILVDILRRRIPGDLAQAIDLLETVETRASRRWCVSLLLREWQLSESERQVVRDRI
jgi:hypothetical protein